MKVKKLALFVTPVIALAIGGAVVAFNQEEAMEPQTSTVVEQPVVSQEEAPVVDVPEQVETSQVAPTQPSENEQPAEDTEPEYVATLKSMGNTDQEIACMEKIIRTTREREPAGINDMMLVRPHMYKPQYADIC